MKKMIIFICIIALMRSVAYSQWYCLAPPSSQDERLIIAELTESNLERISRQIKQYLAERDFSAVQSLGMALLKEIQITESFYLVSRLIISGYQEMAMRLLEDFKAELRANEGLRSNLRYRMHIINSLNKKEDVPDILDKIINKLVVSFPKRTYAISVEFLENFDSRITVRIIESCAEACLYQNSWNEFYTITSLLIQRSKHQDGIGTEAAKNLALKAAGIIAALIAEYHGTDKRFEHELAATLAGQSETLISMVYSIAEALIERGGVYGEEHAKLLAVQMLEIDYSITLLLVNLLYRKLSSESDPSPTAMAVYFAEKFIDASYFNGADKIIQGMLDNPSVKSFETDTAALTLAVKLARKDRETNAGYLAKDASGELMDFIRGAVTFAREIDPAGIEDLNKAL